MKIARAQAFRYTLPLRRPLSLKGVTLLKRTGYLLKLTSDSGMVGWGEAAPLPGFSTESEAKVVETLRWAVGRLDGYRLPEEYGHLEGAGLLPIEDVFSASFALESAYFSLMAAERRQPRYEYLDPMTRPHLMLCALLTGTPGEVLDQAKHARDAGYTAVKVKVGGRAVADDITLVKSLREVLGPEIGIRADANRQWTTDDTMTFAIATKEVGFEYLEEPVAHMPDFVNRLAEAHAPYALDETFYGFYKEIRSRFGIKDIATPQFSRHIGELSRTFRRAAACIWKPTLLYRPDMARELVSGEFAFPVRKLVFSACFESGVGIAFLANMAAAYGGSEVPAGLDTYRYLAEDVLETRLPLDSGRVDLDAINAASAKVNEDRLVPL